MIRFILRSLGLWILAAGFVFFVYDGTKSIAGNQLYVTKLGDTWNAIHSTSLQLLQAAVDAYASPFQAQAKAYTLGGLGAGTHTVVVEATQTHSPSSGGSWVWVDAFDVTP